MTDRLRSAGFRPPSRLIPAGALLLGLSSACGLGASDMTWQEAAALTGGDPQAGRVLIRDYGCGSCHTVPGVAGADAQVGPSLAGLSRRMYIAGVLPNQPDNLVRWILNPPAVDSFTAMPRVGVSEQEARDIAAYLYGVD